MNRQFSPGTLVRARGRSWVVQPSEHQNLVRIKPLGGSEDEVTAIYLPLKFREDVIESDCFPMPGKSDLGDISTAKQLFNAARLSFRNGAGPFRSLAQLSFRPRAYQMVPLIMALRHAEDPVRLLIADDVGVGKTIEALLGVKELLERRVVKRFAVVCLPHLCEQWQQEIKDKFDIDAVIIRSNTQARLDREIQGDTSVYDYYPFQIISIDYIKGDTRRNVFINECPELVVVDEAHTCARPTGASKSQQHRYHLIHDIAAKPNQHLILLTATPHSGKPEEFQSLLGLLNPDFETIDLAAATSAQRKQLATHFVQRKRADVEKWLDEKTIFPKRDAGEFDYQLSGDYLAFFEKILEFAQKLISGEMSNERQRRIHYWTALALLRGVMSSPAAGVDMLRNRMEKLDFNPDDVLDGENPVLDRDYQDSDSMPTQVMTKTAWSVYQGRQLKEFADQLDQLRILSKDCKADAALLIIEDWLDNNYSPVVFCRYIATAKYVGEILKPALQAKFKNIDIQVITSEDPDEVRRERIVAMGSAKKRLLICTDCLSEGINLQEHFTAVLHYDLPWNPNRLEQREGRVDRFGQTADEVKAYLLYGSNNPIDGVVFDVLLKKVREIKKTIGISIPFPEDSQTILDTVLQSVLLNPKRRQANQQPEFDFGSEERTTQTVNATKAIEAAAQREKHSRSVFAQNAIKANEIEQDLREIDEALGNPKAVEEFVSTVVNTMLGSQIEPDRKGYALYTTNLPPALRNTLPPVKGDRLKVSFESPTPEGYLYLGRNHLFTEQLCQHVLAHSINHRDGIRAARAAVIKSRQVDSKTTVVLFRCRNVIEEKRRANHQIVAEEMLLWGYRGMPGEEVFLSHDQARELLNTAQPSADLPPESRWFDFLQPELEYLESFKERFDEVALSRAQHLVEAHERFSKAVGGDRYQVVSPVLPMDIMGVYVIVPDHSLQG
jgi:superfamily II DNA or RNA helicase